MSIKKNAQILIITGLGLNCEMETAYAFRAAGGDVTCIHINDLLREGDLLMNFHILAIIGGFSFADHLGAGTALSIRLRTRLWEPLKKFVSDGRLVLGICNGFQTLTKLGLIPNLNTKRFEPVVSLVGNECGVFQDRWVTLKINEKSPCVFFKGIDKIDLPVRHGEGRLFCPDAEIRQTIMEGGLVAAYYAEPESGSPTSEYPYNPNGSDLNAAAICDPSGRMLGIMPHPEAFIHPFNHPRWFEKGLEAKSKRSGDGLKIFKNAVDFARNEF